MDQRLLAGRPPGDDAQPIGGQPGAQSVPPKSAGFLTEDAEREGLDVLDRLNRRRLEALPGDSRLEARIASYELAARMQGRARGVDLDGETASDQTLYGMDDPATEPTSAATA